MTKFQTQKPELARKRFLDLFKDFSEEEQLRLIESLSKIQEVIR